MIIGKVFEFPSKPEQPGLSSSIRLEVTMEQTCYMQIRPIQRASPHPCLPLSFHSIKPMRMAPVIVAEGGVSKY